MKKRLLIYRPDNIGDNVLFSGALRHIRLRYPSHRVYMAVMPHVMGLYGNCPHIDRLINAEWLSCWPAGIAGALPGRVTGRALSMMRFGFWDVVIFPLKSPAACYHKVVGRLFSREKIGVSAGDGINQTPEQNAHAHKYYSARLDVPVQDKWLHELELNRRFLGFIGCGDLTQEDVSPELWTSRADRETAKRLLPFKGDGASVGIFPSAASARRVWPVDRYADVLDMLGGVSRAAILGGQGDLHICKALEERLAVAKPEMEVVNLAGRTTLNELAEVLRALDLLIGTESSALHIMTALKRPTVAIMGGGHYGRFYPWGDPAHNRAAAHHMECWQCGWRCIYGSARCIQAVTPEQVAGEAVSALKCFGEQASDTGK